MLQRLLGSEKALLAKDVLSEPQQDPARLLDRPIEHPGAVVKDAPGAIVLAFDSLDPGILKHLTVLTSQVGDQFVIEGRDLDLLGGF
jgi:hypothetical protein